MARSGEGGLPVVDVGSLWSGVPDGELSRLGAQVCGACRSTGFFYIVNHGVARDLIAGVFEANRRFHARPLADKLKIKLNRWHRGYQTLAGSTLVSSARFAPARHPNQLESFFVRPKSIRPIRATGSSPCRARISGLTIRNSMTQSAVTTRRCATQACAS